MLRPSGPLRLCWRSRSSDLCTFLTTGPPHRALQGQSARGNSLARPTTARQSTVSPFRGCLQNSPTTPRFSPGPLHLVRKERKYKTRSTLAFPELLALEALCRVNAVPTSGSIRPCRDSCPRSIPRSAFIPPHHQPTLRRRYPSGLSIQADPVAAAPHASLSTSLLLAGVSDESIADIGVLLHNPPPWPQVLFSCQQLVIVPVTSKRQGDTTNTTPSQHHRWQVPGTRSGETYLFRHSKTPGKIHSVTPNLIIDRLSFGLNTLNGRSHLGHIPTIYHYRRWRPDLRLARSSTKDHHTLRSHHRRRRHHHQTTHRPRRHRLRSTVLQVSATQRVQTARRQHLLQQPCPSKCSHPHRCLRPQSSNVRATLGRHRDRAQHHTLSNSHHNNTGHLCANSTWVKEAVATERPRRRRFFKTSTSLPRLPKERRRPA